MTLTVFAVRGIPEIRPGDDLALEITRAVAAQGERLRDRDVVVVAQKIVSKSEGQLVRLSDVVPGDEANRHAAEHRKDARVVEVVLRESKTVIRMERGVIISETHHGFVCANAGVDRSNAGAPDTVVLLPKDPDASALALREALRRRDGVNVAAIVSDTFGRAWREGHANVAIGVAGVPALLRYMGQLDPDGYELRVTEIALADEVAGAAELVMGKLKRCPVAVVRGVEYEESGETGQTYVRPREKDLFR